jgi:hypothetical protein
VAEPNRLRSFILIVVTSIFFVGGMIEGARQHKDARLAEERQGQIADGISKIQSALNSHNLTPDEVLAAAAAKIMQQGQELDSAQNRLDSLEHPPRNPKGFYEDNALVGIAPTPPRNISRTEIAFDVVTQAQDLDFDKQIEYGDLVLFCKNPGSFGGSSPGGGIMTETHYPNVHCNVIGQRR